MANLGWTRPESPFHIGELSIQARLGMQNQIDKQGRRMIREYLPEQAQQFFAQLPYIIAGVVDADGNPWASILLGNPGFLSAPDAGTLRITAELIFGDPLVTTLANGIDIGLLGIELHTRQRYRLNGTVTATDRNGFAVQVRQSFGNCPQYIQARTLERVQFAPTKPKPVHEISALLEPEKALITSADTFFITTAYQSESAGVASGVDVSHRGGKPGFVRVDGDRILTIPDFSGNCHFNTFGNLELNPRAGLLFIDFVQGNLLYLTGNAEVIWSGTEINAYEGAERLLRFQLKRGWRVENSIPRCWSAPEFSPFLGRTGSW
jgi:predicted pyridoxine 5'-phosphate oxidase superfamily flavin-nucleotide-binding protein